MSREAAERETTIQWSDADNVLHVWTAQLPMARRLKKIRGARLVETSRGPEGQWWGEDWEVPIKALVLRNPTKGGTPPRGRPFVKRTGASPRKIDESARPESRPEAP